MVVTSHTDGNIPKQWLGGFENASLLGTAWQSKVKG